MDLSRPEAAAFRDGMFTIAQDGSYLEIITAMFAAEWMYWSWCREAAGIRIADPEHKGWVDLHTSEEFAAQACWLRDRIDAAGPKLDAAQQAQLSAIFAEVQRLEVDFHAVAYTT